MQPPIRVFDSWRHQAEAYWFAEPMPAANLAMKMGTGKSKVAIDLSVNANARRILILCPTSVRAVWRRELATHGPSITPVILDKGSVTKRAEQAKAALRNNTAPVAVVCNYEAAHRKGMSEVLLSTQWDFVILDESHRIKGANTLIGKFCAKLHYKARRRLCLTGTPMSSGPLDIFGQFRFLDPSIFGWSWHRFRHTYGVFGNSAIPQMITGYQRQDDLQAKFAMLSFHVDSSVLDLPPALHNTIPCELNPAARKIYDQLAEELIAEVGEGYVTVANTLVKTLRLRQIVSGFVKLDDVDIVKPIDDSKRQALADLLQDIAEPVVVFAEFSHDLETTRRVAESLGLRYGEISGRRHDITDHGTMPDDIDVMGAQYQAGGIGIDLTRAAYCIFYSPTYNLANYEQTLARVHRPGQTRTVNYYHLVAERTIDEAVNKALAKKRNIIETVMAAIRDREYQFF
jgi:SNF2 family DNA or RNA helicase